MTAEIKVRLKPFNVPNSVALDLPMTIVNSLTKPQEIELSDLPEDAVLQLCEDFKQAVLAKHRIKKNVGLLQDMIPRSPIPNPWQPIGSPIIGTPFNTIDDKPPTVNPVNYYNGIDCSKPKRTVGNNG